MMNGTYNETISPFSISEAFKISYILITALILIVGVIGNSLVIYVVSRFSSMQTIANIHLMNLSIADLVFLISGFIFLSNVIKSSFIFGLIGCKIYLIMTGVNSFTSTYSMTLMSIDRYLAVCHPISSKSIRNPKMTKWIILGLWIFSFLLMTPLILYGEINSHTVLDPSSQEPIITNNSTMNSNQEEIDLVNFTYITQHACVIIWPSALNVASHGFTWYNFALGFLCPVIIICILYPLVIIRLGNVGPRNKSQERRDSNRRITRLVLAIILIYILLWLPYWVLQLFNILNTVPYSRSVQQLIFYLNLEMLCLNYLNSAINPILYAFMSANFRSSFRNLVICHQNSSYGFGGMTTQVPQETVSVTLHKTSKTNNCQPEPVHEKNLSQPPKCTEIVDKE